MHRSLSILFVFVLLLGLLAPAVGAAPLAAPAAPMANALRISQVYGGGGGAGAPYTHDYIEIFNSGSTAVLLSGYSLQYASATGTGNFGSSPTQLTELPAVTLQPGQYYLVQEGSGSTGSPLPTPDHVDPTPIAMSGTGGKVALASIATTLGCNGSSTACTPAQVANIVDLVGYGNANYFEGSAATPAPSATLAVFRAGGGCTDTDQNGADFATSAPAPRNTATATKSCGGTTDVAPTVSSTTPASNATNVATSATLTVNFSEAVDVAAGGVTLECPVGTPVTLSGLPASDVSSVTLTPSASLPAGVTCTGTVLAALVTDNDGTADQMAGNHTWSFSTVAANYCDQAYTPIYTIQGSGTVSPVVNTVVDVEGVVVGDFQGNTGHYGFYVQDPTGDGNALTSDGVFVYVPDANALSSVAVAVGDVVHLTGTVKEFNTLTEIDTLTALQVCGTTTPLAPVTVDLPEATNGDLERYEGMLINIPETLTVSQNYFQGRYGEVTVSSDGRLYNPTNGNGLGESSDLNARRILVLDDGYSGQNPNPIPYIGDDNTLRAGDTIPGLTGVLDYGPINSDTSIRDYRLQPTAPVSITRVNARTAAPDSVGGSIKVASFNVLNYFNGNGAGGGFPTSRGASNAAEFTRQRDKIIAALTAINADVVGLMEIERDGYAATSAVQDLVNGLNAATASGTYAVVAPTTDPGTDEIAVAMIYKPASVTPAGAGQFYQTTAGGYTNLFDRPPLAQTFTTVATGEKFTVIVNHFKSKGSCPSGTGPDADQGDGQGCWNAKRTVQAQELLGFIGQLQTSTGDQDVLVIGDLNSYGAEDPINTLTTGGLVNEVAKIPAAVRYSYIFDGFSGYLDHGLATPQLDAQVSGQTIWHINADEPSVIDYNTEFKPQDLYTPTPYRSSDHDPVIIGLNLSTPDTTAPDTTILTTPANPTTSTSAEFTFDGTDGGSGVASFECKLDDASFAACASPQSYTGLAVGSHTFQVRAVDNAGNEDPTPASFTWQIYANVGLSEVWADAAWAGSAPGQEVASGKFFGINAFATIQAALDAVLEGGTVHVAAGTYAGGNTVTKNGLMINLNGATVGPGSPAFTIAADDVTIQGPGVLDGNGSASPAVLVNGGADNFTLKDVEVREWADGVQIAGSVTSLKIIDNFIHDNTDAGLQVDAGVAIGGVINIYGNLFKVNGGNGVQNDGATANLPAQYNSWGHIGGPAAGDGVSTNVDASNPTYLEYFIDMDPDTLATVRRAGVGTSFDVVLKGDASKVNGIAFKLTYPYTYLQLNSAVMQGTWAGASCVTIPPVVGVVEGACFLDNTEWSGDAAPIIKLNFTVLTLSPSPLTTALDLLHDDAVTNAGAHGGAKVYVNNAGFGLPSVPERDITDADDGTLILGNLANYTGFVDLQGRPNESGATLYAKNLDDKLTSVNFASGTSVSSGAYTTAHLAPRMMFQGETFYFQFDRALYLPTTQMGTSPTSGSVPTTWQHLKELLTAPTTPLANLVLLGGDGTDDDVIDVADAGCMGASYRVASTCTGGAAPNSDVNGDGITDILDLSLMGGNYYKVASPWTP